MRVPREFAIFLRFQTAFHVCVKWNAKALQVNLLRLDRDTHAMLVLSAVRVPWYPVGLHVKLQA